jgi:hypothetical protein
MMNVDAANARLRLRPEMRDVPVVLKRLLAPGQG